MSNVKKVVELLDKLKPELERLPDNLVCSNMDDRFFMEKLIWDALVGAETLKEYLEV